MRRLLSVVLAGVAALGAVAPAEASTRSKIIADCADDGRLQGNYSPSALRNARQNLPSDVAEYTDCADVLRRAELGDGGSGGTGGSGGAGGAAGPGTGGGGGGGSEPLTAQTDADRQALEDATSGKPVRVGAGDIVPGASGLRAGAPRNDIPATLIAVLIGLAVAGLALAVPGARRLVPALKPR